MENGQDRQTGDLYLPADSVSRIENPDQTEQPLVIVIHGGGWTNRDRSDMVKFGERLSAAGYAAFNIDYRLAPEHRHPAQLEDVRSAIAFAHTLAETYPVDPDRIALLGYSAGAHLALLAAARADPETSPVRAVIAGGAPTMLWIYPDSPLITKLIGGTPDEYPEAYQDASPVNHINARHPPTYLYHGRADLLVRPRHSRGYAAALEEHDIPHHLRQRLFLGHILTFLWDGPTWRESRNFLDQYL
ncbi:MAG: alpha/beta hydrolase [Verrucomicrobia bacterium]|nr:alpha/beta hydrolase [Verrucomicrobiota bacterium]